ncbi:hypothetical protein K9L27_00980 [Candidatus Gracilibacteria bacterium]|nr:hypothetical protein [Candidatus Gracilibacteria bacterium]
MTRSYLTRSFFLIVTIVFSSLFIGCGSKPSAEQWAEEESFTQIDKEGDVIVDFKSDGKKYIITNVEGISEVNLDKSRIKIVNSAISGGQKYEFHIRTYSGTLYKGWKDLDAVGVLNNGEYSAESIAYINEADQKTTYKLQDQRIVKGAGDSGSFDRKDAIARRKALEKEE